VAPIVTPDGIQNMTRFEASPKRAVRVDRRQGWFAIVALVAAVGSAGMPAHSRKPEPKSITPPATATAPTKLPGGDFPALDTVAQLDTVCDQGLRDVKARVLALEKRKGDPAWMAAYDEVHTSIEDLFYPIQLLSNVHPDKALRDAAQACELKWQDYLSALAQNETLYKTLKAIQTRDDVDARFKRLALEGFEDSGVNLPAPKRDRAKAISDKLTELSQAFDRNVREASVMVAFKRAELEGVPPDVIERAKRDAGDVLLLGLDMPTYQPVMSYASDGPARERMWRAKQNEGGEANLKLLSEIVKLRKEYAQLFGFDSYADFLLRRRMAGGAKRATRFLDELRAEVDASERREIVELRDAKAAHTGHAAAKLERWDLIFYQEREKQRRFSVDQNAFRAHFPPQESLAFVMSIAERLFGVKYTRVDAKLWHPQAQAYAVTDAASGKPIAGLLVDLHPREGKYNHAAVFSYRSGATRDAKSPRLPQAALIVNFDRKGLTLDELETLLHEFGHALHNNLSATRYAMQGGTSTLQDFVEAPSQMLEDWVYDAKVLATFKDVCAACKPVPQDMLVQAVKARDHGKATRYARQHLYASYDLVLHSAKAPEPMSTWAAMEGSTPLGHVPNTKFPSGFGHIAGGYAAGYYGYLWSEVIAFDLRTAFAGDKLSPATGARYRNAILANGGQKAPQDIVRQFLGRESNSKAFFDHVKK
jgi:thimet oligopeptidase